MNKIILELLNGSSVSVPNLILDNYKKLDMTNDEFLVYLQIKRSQSEGVLFPAMDELAKKLDISQNELFTLLQSLQDKKLMTINQKSHGSQLNDFYDFSLLYEKIVDMVSDVQQTQSAEKQDMTRQTVIQNIEREFNRTLSSIELEQILQWLNDDHYTPDMLQLALKEAVLNQVYSLSYMERILVTWSQKNLKTPEQITQSINERRKSVQNNSNQASDSSKHVPVSKKIPIMKLTNTKKTSN